MSDSPLIEGAKKLYDDVTGVIDKIPSPGHKEVPHKDGAYRGGADPKTVAENNESFRKSAETKTKRKRAYTK